ncbi:ParB/RepB/Spo0J family partition protein [Roseisalinus antarcticus]|uniref:ParB-like nuclease domain protein n=1 Tax=Roseisalinus antarcticus TaxID=254357 RepID=A0A1Y5TP67_9RHOB|nr:ParB N-terminal domain-containing protein [Roseisalinus antarcticus]SLN68825.1 ParB-like nuclease domain protein [Roseisalinus antarcticus]
MAKRKRLTPARSDVFGAAPGPAGLETKAFGLSAPPIASVAGEASASAALAELSQSMEQARAEGRLVLSIPLEQIDAGYLVRDRIAVEADETRALVESLRARGQQTPIEVAETPGGEKRYGLISGWRRLQALSALRDETGAVQFGSVLALLRRPEEASDAYRAMVEENEIRVGLSYYERARIAARAVEQGVFADDTAALQTLFASASRPRRSKIKSFLPIVAGLDGALRFPQAIGERLGLQLSKALTEEPGLAARAAEALAAAPRPDAAAEQAVLSRLLAGGSRRGAPAEAPALPRVAPGQTCTLAREVRLRVAADGSVTLYGPGVTDAFRTRLLKAFGAPGA